MIGYFGRHWRGELPLAVAWWVNGIGVTALTLALDLYGGGLLPAADTRLGFTVLLAAGVALLLFLPAWQVIGIFRAADRHADEVGTILAARATQSLATILTVLLAMRFLMFAGEGAAAARIAYGIGTTGYTVAVTHGGRVLEVDGAILFGLADEVRQALEAQPRVRRMRLNSGGGALSEARKLRALIVARALDTDSTRNCSSACVSAYMAGRHRLLRRAARLGFHLPRNPGFGLRGAVTDEYLRELRWFGEQGVPSWFRERWVMTGRIFWYPTPAQLRAAAVVQSFVGQPRPGEEIYFE